jgi:hypothetical protein
MVCPITGSARSVSKRRAYTVLPAVQSRVLRSIASLERPKRLDMVGAARPQVNVIAIRDQRRPPEHCSELAVFDARLYIQVHCVDEHV